jgi:hypothetical protein
MIPLIMLKLKKQNSSGQVNLLLVLAVFLGIGTVLFGGLSIVSFRRAQKATASLEKAKSDAFEAGRAQQKTEDEERFSEEQKTPFRSYVAPSLFGGFELKFPKVWNLYVIENDGASNQVDLIAHPSLIRVLPKSDNAYALRAMLSKELKDAAYRKYENLVKTGKLKAKTIFVSGIESIRLDGRYDQKHDGVVVLVPVRDKTLILITEDQKYLPDFEQVLSQSKIVP